MNTPEASEAVLREMPAGQFGSRRFLHETVLPYDCNDCLVWPFYKNRGGYPTIKIDRQQFRVHRLLCISIHGQPPTPNHQAAHSCGNRACVNKRHISWKTPRENSADKFRHGTVVHGERHLGSKLTVSDVLQIKGLKGKLLQREIAEKFGIDQRSVSCIHLGKTWVRVGAQP